MNDVKATSAEPKAIPTFQKEVRCFDAKELVKDALQYMCEHEFTQVVVRRHGKLGMLSTDGIVKWLTALLLAGKDSVIFRRVGEVIPYERTDLFKIMKPTALATDVRAAFRIDNDGPRLMAVIITDDGTPRGSPIGFATSWDTLLDYSDDFRDVRWQGRSFKLSARQADVVRLLYRAYEHGTPELGDKEIVKLLGTAESRLRDTFRKSKVWDTLIVKGSRRGMRRLAL